MHLSPKIQEESAMVSYSGASRLASFTPHGQVGRPLFLALGGLVAIAICGFFLLSLFVPYLGLDVTYRSGKWSVNQVDEGGNAYRDGIRPGDEILQVNGLAPERVASGTDYIGAFRARSVEVVSVNGQRKLSSSSTGPVPGNAIEQAVATFAVGFSFWIVGFLSFVRKSGSRQVLFLYTMGMFLPLGIVAGLGPLRGWEIGRHLETLGLVTSPWIIIRFFLEFPFCRRLHLFRKDMTWIVYIPAALMIVTYVLLAHDDSAFYSWFRQLTLMTLALGLLASFVIAGHSYLASSYARHRQQMKIVALGAAVSILPLAILALIPEASGFGAIIRPQGSLIPKIALIALPLSLGYVIREHQLVDIDRAISRGIWYGSLLCFFVVSYIFFDWLTSVILPALPYGWHIVLISALIASLVISTTPARGALGRAIDARANRDRYDYKLAASEIISDVASQMEIEDVTHLLAMSVTRFLKLEGACVLLYSEDQRSRISAAFGTYAEIEAKRLHLVRFCQTLADDQMFPNKASEASGAAFLIPLMRNKKQTGLLVLGAKRSGADFNVDDIYFLFNIKAQGSLAIENALLLRETRDRADQLKLAFDQLKQYSTHLENSKRTVEDSYVGIIRTLVLAVESRSPYTKGHSERVTQLARRLGVEIGLSPTQLHNLQVAARIHDIGKIGIPDTVLLKPGPLEHQERAEIELHPLKGVEIVRFLDFLKDAIPIVESHHEWANGGGYPRGLYGEEIPIGARILAVADAFDAMTSDRPYRKAMTATEAIDKLRGGAGTQWDPEVVDVLARLPASGLQYS